MNRHPKRRAPAEVEPCDGKLRKSCSVQAALNEGLLAEDVKAALRDGFKLKRPLSLESGIQLLAEPFTCCIIPAFLKESKFLTSLKDELLDLSYLEKNNDLYKFHQSSDLKSVNTPYISSLRDALSTEFTEWLEDVTSIQLRQTIDMFSSRYDYTDVLLCHDDEMEGRRIAFILYLVPPWNEADGGMLDLFNMDEKGQPQKVVQSLLPEWNKFVFFEVTPASFHQVSEVLTEDKTRLSVSGWFHGTPVARPDPYHEPEMAPMPPQFVKDSVLREWINPVYFEDEIQMQIQDKFQADSEIELQDFLQADKYDKVARALSDGSISWKTRGPPNKRCLEEADEDELPPEVTDCMAVLRSEAMFLLLSNMTGLTLHGLAADGTTDESEDDDGQSRNEAKNPTGEGNKKSIVTADRAEKVSDPWCRSHVRRWSHGSYTLVHDGEMAEYALDATLYFNCAGWQTDYGGYTSYIAKGEDEELLTVVPTHNSLALVYRDRQTLSFVKHVNSKVKNLPSPCQRFHDLFVVYYE